MVGVNMLGLLFLIFLLFGGYIIVYIVDTLNGETKLVRKYKQDKLNQSIESKIHNGEDLTQEEKEEIKRKVKLMNLAYNLKINDSQTKER